ncbi:MAG: hypothetical protein NTV44_00655 [Firmicutes bacterium]|nr:hypothetical protein [Bacillota bacterium]
MENLQMLLEKGEYQKVLEKTLKSQDVVSLFSRAAAYLGLGRDEDALRLIAKEHIEMEKKLPQLIKLHVELLITLRKYDEAFDAIKHYGDLPYFSQECEELIREYPKKIRQAENAASSTGRLDDREIISTLSGQNEAKILIILEYITRQNPTRYIAPIKKLLLNPVNDFVKTFALLILVSEKYQEEVKLLKNDREFAVVPYELDPPFEGPLYEELVSKLQRHGEDPYVVNIALEILRNYIMAIYSLYYSSCMKHIRKRNNHEKRS